jgi:hypothetical protein
MRTDQELKEETLARMEINQERMDAKIGSSQGKMEVRIEANNEKFEVLQGTLVSHMDIHQARPVSTQESQDGYTSREDGGYNTLHPAQVRGDHETWG